MRHLLVLLLLAALPSLAQPILFEIPRTRQFRMDEIQPTMDLRATHLEAPDEFSKAHQLNELKSVHAQRYGIAKDSERGGMLQKTMAEIITGRNEDQIHRLEKIRNNRLD